MTEDDKTLIFQTEFQALSNQLKDRAFRLSKNREDAEDLFQETMAKVWQNLHRYTPGSNPAAWANVVMRNLWINKLAAKSNQQTYELDEANEDLYPTLASAEDLCLESIVDERLRTALRALSSEHRQVILLRSIQDLSYEDIAELLDIPKSTVGSRLATARENIKAFLERYDDDRSGEDSPLGG